MLIWAVVAIALVAGAPIPIVGAIAVVGISPVIGTASLAAVSLIYAWWRRKKRRLGQSEAGLFREIAGDVAAGSSLREAIRRCESDLVSPAVRRLCDCGASMVDVGAEIAGALPVNGRRFAALCSMTEQSGSSVVDAIGTFAQGAVAEEQIGQKTRASLAQARMSAWVVGVAPLALTGLVVASRGIPEPGGAPVVVPMAVGAGLELVGTAIVFAVSGRAAR